MPNRSMGWDSFVGLGNESAWGTSVARTKFIEVVSANLKLTNALHNAEAARGRSLRRTFRGLRHVAGDIVSELNYEGFEFLLYHAFGAVSTTTPVGQTNAREHTFTLADALLPGLSIEYKKGEAQTFLAEGCKVNDLKLAFGLDSIVTATFGIIGEDETKISASTPTYPAEQPMLWSQVVLQKDAASFDCVSAEISLGNGLNADRRKLGSQLMKEPSPGRREIGGTLTIDFEDPATFYDLLAADTDFKLNVICTGGAIETGETYALDIELPVCAIGEWDGPIPDTGPIQETIPFVAKYDITNSADAIKATLMNSVATVP